MIEIKPHPRHNVHCDIAGCRHPIEPLWIYESVAPMPLRFVCCKTHLREIIEVGKTYLGIVDEKPLEADLMVQLEGKDVAIDVLKEKIKELEGKIKAVATKQVDTSKGRASQTVKGKKR